MQRRRMSTKAMPVLLVAFALVAVGCDTTVETTTTTVATTVTAAAPETTATTEAPPVEGFTYRVGMLPDILRPNHWAMVGPDDTVAMCWVFCPTKPALFRIMYPGIVVAPDAAAGQPVDAIQEGDLWTVVQPIRDDYTWSDGSLLTADDIVFTFETVRDAGLGATWLAKYPHLEGSSPRLLDVEAIDDFTVKYTFDGKPGAAVWPHQVGIAPIMPKAPWEPVVDQALQSEDPALALYETDALEVGDVFGGPVMYAGNVEAESIDLIRNDLYANEGFLHQFWDDGSYALNGELLYGEGAGPPAIEFTEGPYLDRVAIEILADETEAISALAEGDIDYWFPSAMSPAVRRQGLEAENLDVIVNPSNGFNYLGFNLRRSPSKFLGFRQAMAYFDKENLANNVLQGAFTPLYVMVPEGNVAWYNEEAAAEIASRYVGLSPQERLNLAYAALEDDGFTWLTPPERDEDGNIVTAGAGIIDPEGNPVRELEIYTPPVAFRPVLVATSLWLEDWAEGLGITAEAEQGIDWVQENVWRGVGVEPDFDLYLFGWALGNPGWPRFHEAFFHTRNLAETNDGRNSTGYSKTEFDALADAMLTETDQAVAFNQMWQMERMLADDLPYVMLLSAPITEFYNRDLGYPFTRTLGGIQNLNGMPGLVEK